MSHDPQTIADWKDHWQDEFDASYLYGVLAELESDPSRKDIFVRFSEVERRHLQMWEELLRQNGIAIEEAPKPTRRARFLAFVARRLSRSALLSLMLREEGLEVKSYLKMHQEAPKGDEGDLALTLAQESAEHADNLRGLVGGEGEPWHRTGSGGFLRNVVYGFNDGLTANFGLLAGVIGATTTGSERFILVSGIAGMVADALSMGASGYLAAKSEQEVYDYEISMEKQEIELMPEVEEAELALIYEMKGIGRERAETFAKEVMQSPARALQEQVREELKIGEAHTTPLREGWVTGTATAFGAFIPVFPFLFLSGTVAIILSFSISMLSHFGVGAARSVFTGRGLLRSGFDMFVVGLGVALVGYFVGESLVKLL